MAEISVEINKASLVDLDSLKKDLYKTQRAASYPSIGDQLDSLFHAGVFPEEMAAKIQAVKNKYPKGGE